MSPAIMAGGDTGRPEEPVEASGESLIPEWLLAKLNEALHRDFPDLPADINLRFVTVPA